MELGIFVQGHLPGPDAFDREKEHQMLLREVELIECADRNHYRTTAQPKFPAFNRPPIDIPTQDSMLGPLP